MMIPIEDMTEKQAKKTLQDLINSLDELDADDFFGTEGWRHFLGFEEK